MMPHFLRNTRLWCLIILIFSAFTVNALTLNPLIEAPHGHTIIDHEPLLFNDQIIFVTEKDDKHSLWAYDLTNNEHLNLQHFDKNILGIFYKIDDRFYFKERDEPSQIWQSDGTVSGTQAVDGLIVGHTVLHQQNNILFTKGSDYPSREMIFFDGSTIQRYLLPGEPNDYSVCAFSVNDVVIASKQSSYNSYINLIRYQNGSQTNYTSGLNQLVETNSGYAWYFDNTCFVYINGEGLEDIMVIPEQGDHYFLGEELDYLTVSFLTQFKGYYYAVATDGHFTKRIIKISPDLSQVIHSVPLGQLNDEITLINSYNYLIGYVMSGIGSPYYRHATYYDADLNEISGLDGLSTKFPTIYPRDGGETVVRRHDTTNLVLNTLTTDIISELPGLDLNRDELVSVITSKNKTETYTLVKNLQTGQSSIKKLDATPDIGSLSVGNWYDPDYQSQGMSIVEGLRDDGSRYLFVTLYLFQDGEPLWLAGTSNISYPQPALDIELGTYSGPGLWQADTPANVEKFADMTLSMSSCHRMMLAMETEDGQSFNLELQRMVNKNIDHLCQD